ncbi:MAG TPA: TOBE domain-containing protein, partial [Steroidobacteraceae bacterium]
LLSQPRLLLLDEPLASLDVARREEVLPYLEALRDRLSLPMVYVSHQFDEVMRLATHVVLLEAGQVVAQGSIADVSVLPQLRAIVGPDAVGAVIDGVVTSVGEADRLAAVKVGRGTLRVTTTGVKAGDRVRVQLLAREIILGIEPPRGLSVRNALEGTIEDITDDGDDAQLVKVDVGGAIVLSRVTTSAAQALALTRGKPVWLLVKAVSLRAHPFRTPAPG